jgi:hypothetical protein
MVVGWLDVPVRHVAVIVAVADRGFPVKLVRLVPAPDRETADEGGDEQPASAKRATAIRCPAFPTG